MLDALHDGCNITFDMLFVKYIKPDSVTLTYGGVKAVGQFFVRSLTHKVPVTILIHGAFYNLVI